MKCRVCRSTRIEGVGTAEYYSGFAWPIFDCQDCGCRFTNHDESIYERLHTETKSIPYYNGYRDLAEKCGTLFQQRDLSGLRSELSHTSKYKFVIEEIERGPSDAKLLEFGCSRGYLSSYFILSGYDVLGVDASHTAVNGARAAFGNYFVPVDSPAISAGAPYDAIYHVGMIGCVADPLGLTTHLLSLLKPGGKLIFNAPNFRSLSLNGQLWIDSAPPPDVVTLFRPGLWTREFRTVAHTDEEEEMCEQNRALTIGVKRLVREKWSRPSPLSLGDDNSSTSAANSSQAVWCFLKRGVGKAARMTGLSRFAPRQPSEFGLFVKMVRRAALI